MARVLVIDERDSFASLLVERLRESPTIESAQVAPESEDGFGGELSGHYAGLFQDRDIDTVVYSPPLRGARSGAPDLADAETVFQRCASLSIKSFILLSSAAIYGASHHNPGLISESRTQSGSVRHVLGGRWADLEGLASIYLGGHSGMRLTILRPAAMPLRGGTDYFSRLFRRSLAITLPGHDPSIQILSSEDLATAICCAIEAKRAGVYNVAPDTAVPLRVALKLSRSKRVPVARWLQRFTRAALAPLRLAHPIRQLDYIRYSWTISNRKIKEELGFVPARTSSEAIAAFAARDSSDVRSCDLGCREYDDFGMDKDYIAGYGRTMFKFLHDYYWRIEVNGLERVPRDGRAVLVGVHRGFMPWDGVMALHLLARKLNRYPRFLIHPTLVKFPFLFNFMTKLGGIIACQENADYVLQRDGMLGMFPEGIHGAFTLYRDAYRLGRFGRDEFVKMALRNSAPLVPFVTVGSAEIFPILKKIRWRWWERLLEWPCLPITPTFPFLPVPLPSKWHTQFLAPLHIEKWHPPEDADDPVIVRMISNEVRSQLEEAIKRIRSQRKSIFYGSVFSVEIGKPALK
ncbi:MAG TPA: 1-acyl-sn-glycerol-3-phosphate acyltransferase [Blastocatellia bacterium]|nr:1-acyl-sn-glycerol-3-phosphate acyltransferase [Blastocatellia bacterium]